MTLGVAADIFQRAHIVQPVRLLDQQDPDILRHGQQQLAEILRLLRPVGHGFQLAQLGHAIHQTRDTIAEQRTDIVHRRDGILNRVMQQTGDDRIAVEFLFGEDARDFDRMREIRIAGFAQLQSVGLHGKYVSAVQRAFIGTGIVAENTLYELILPHHAAMHPEAGGMPSNYRLQTC